jgi:hypothetical protein
MDLTTKAMLKQLSIISAIAITVAAIAPTAEAGRMRRPGSGGGRPTPTPVVVTPPRNVTQTNVIDNLNDQVNTVAGSGSSCKRGCPAAATGITAGNQTNTNDITQAAAGGGNVNQANEIVNTNRQINTVVGNGGIQAGTQTNTNTIKQTVSQ